MVISVVDNIGSSSFMLMGYRCYVNVKYHGSAVCPSGWHHRVWKVRLKYKDRARSFDYKTGLLTGFTTLNFNDFVESLKRDYYLSRRSFTGFRIETRENDSQWARDTYNRCCGTRYKIEFVFRTNYRLFFNTFVSE